MQVTGAAAATKDQAVDTAAVGQHRARQAADATYDATVGSASTAAGKAQQAAHDTYHATRGKAGDAYDAAKDTASAAAGTAQTTAGKAYDATAGAAKGAADTAQKAAAGAYDATAGAASDAYEGLSSTLESYIEWARQKTVATQDEAKRIAEARTLLVGLCLALLAPCIYAACLQSCGASAPHLCQCLQSHFYVLCCMSLCACMEHHVTHPQALIRRWVCRT